ncbi:hypothetical protein FQR65_LT17852 [Abscondita terminalis]|nr:hypothetical protein FQR65_LT17852 [Abscondita terminalis]
MGQLDFCCKDNPEKVLYRSKDYLLAPAAGYELAGDVPNVVFPCAALQDGEKAYFACNECVLAMLPKSDLTKIGKILMMLLVGLIIASLVNLFLKSPMIYWITTYVGVAVFVGLIAYDTQKIKNYFLELNGDESLMGRMAIMGALTLYLDFINLFLFLLRLFGGEESND